MSDSTGLLPGKANPPQSPLDRGEAGSAPSSLPLTGGKLESSLPVKGGRGEGLASEVLTGRGVLPYNKNLTVLARENRKNPTPAETKIWNEVLRMRQFADYKFLRQKPLAGYIVDFYCSELRLVIEIDGDSHAETVEYDTERSKVLQSLGLTVVRYTNTDVMLNIQGVYDDLRERTKELSQGKPLPRLPLTGEEPKSGLSPSPVKGRAGEGLEKATVVHLG